ncbi:MAG: Cof-type HAD-IIB family hydrolase [Lachnospiraceae bacterium]|nr:Cof-type HAD-IIB family hydrolase [Lachnospiraceae bacterium]
MIKLVISDVDGTMVKESSPQMYPAYFDVIRKLRQKGIYVVIASGRQYPSVRRLFHEVEDLVWFIGDGGATLKMDGPVEAFKEIPKEWVREAWADVRKIPECDGILCAPQCAYAPDENSEMFRLMVDNYHYSIESLHGWEKLPDEPVTKFTLYRKTDIQEYAAKEFLPKWEGRMHCSVAGEWWIDCAMPGVNKGAALQIIMDRMGIQKEEVLATGDNPNDMEMLRASGTAYAVESAHPDLKAAADGMIPSYEQMGVLKVWQELLRGQEQ